MLSFQGLHQYFISISFLEISSIAGSLSMFIFSCLRRVRVSNCDEVWKRASFMNIPQGFINRLRSINNQSIRFSRVFKPQQESFDQHFKAFPRILTFARRSYLKRGSGTSNRHRRTSHLHRLIVIVSSLSLFTFTTLRYFNFFAKKELQWRFINEKFRNYRFSFHDFP